MRNGVKNKKVKGQRAKTIEIEPSSGNVFADLALPDPEALLAKAELVQRIIDIITERKLTQARAAAVLGVDQPKVSALMRGKLDKRINGDIHVFAVPMECGHETMTGSLILCG